jgi:hypothetical protein
MSDAAALGSAIGDSTKGEIIILSVILIRERQDKTRQDKTS